MESLEPIFDRVQIKVLELKDVVSSGGIVIPDSAQEKPMEGIVVAVGKGRFDDKGVRIPMDIRVMDHVLFPKYSGIETNVNDEKYLVLSESEILARFITT